MDSSLKLGVLLLTSCLLVACNSSSDPAPTDTAGTGNTETTGQTPDMETDTETTPDPETETTPNPETETTPDPEPETTPEPESEEIVGKKGVFIGHSFFRPAATKFEAYAPLAGIDDHSQQVFFSGGATGTPAQLWANTGKRADIQALLDEGGVETFGMTYHPDEPDIDGYVLWTEYALRENPDIEIFLALPWLTQPHTVTAAQHESTWDTAHTTSFHGLIDQLRVEFPDTKFYCLPYGAAAHELQKLWESGNLTDVTALQGPDESSVYTDNLGHPGAILETAGGLVWLNAIYDFDLADFDDGEDYQADLNTMAMDIMAEHDPAYSAF